MVGALNMAANKTILLTSLVTLLTIGTAWSRDAGQNSGHGAGRGGHNGGHGGHNGGQGGRSGSYPGAQAGWRGVPQATPQSSGHHGHQGQRVFKPIPNIPQGPVHVQAPVIRGYTPPPAVIVQPPARIVLPPPRIVSPGWTAPPAPAMPYNNHRQWHSHPVPVYAPPAAHWGRSHGSRWAYSPGFRHYRYPSIGWTVPLLGVGALTLAYAGSQWYWDRGVWYQPSPAGFIVAAPPNGALVPTLPPDYASIIHNGQPYFYSQGVYYVEVPGQGFRVVPPPGDLPVIAEPAFNPPAVVGTQPQLGSQPPLGTQSPLASLPDLHVIPQAGQTTSQLFSDRARCSQEAAAQTGFDPARNPAADAQLWERAAIYRQYESGCLQSRGYAVN